MKRAYKCLFLCVLAISLLVVDSNGVNAQTFSDDAFGLDVIFILEGSNRYLDPAGARFEMISAAADMLSTDALYLNPGERNTLTLITHDDSNSTVIPYLDERAFSYQQEDMPHFSDPALIMAHQADIRSIADQLADGRDEMEVGLGGTDVGGTGYTNAFTHLGTLLRRMDVQNRQQIVFVVFPFRPHLQNLNAEFFEQLASLRSVIGDTPIHALALPIDRNVETNQYLRDTPLTAQDWTNGLNNYGFSGSLFSGSNSDALVNIYELIGNALASVPSSTSEYIRRIPLDDLTSLQMPPFVSSAVLVGFGNFAVTEPDSRLVVRFEQYDQGRIAVIENPSSGTYQLQGTTDAAIWLRFGTPQLSSNPDALQWRAEELRYQVNDVFGRPLTQSTADISSINATLTHLSSNETLPTQFSSVENRIGEWTSSFNPPHEGSYRLDIAVSLTTGPTADTTLQIPPALLNASAVSVIVLPVTADLSSIPSEQPILRYTDFTVQPIPAGSLTDADLRGSDAVVCVDFESPSMSESARIQLVSAGDGYGLAQPFAPTFAERYTATVTVRRAVCLGEEIAEIGQTQFTARPIFIDFVDPTSALPFVPQMTQFLPSRIALGFFTLNGDGSPSLIASPLDIAPTVTFDKRLLTANDEGRYNVTLPAPNTHESVDFPLEVIYSNSGGTQTHVGFGHIGINAAESVQKVTLPVSPTELTITAEGDSAGRTEQPRQFDYARIAVGINSLGDDQTYQSSDLNNDGGSIIVTASYDDHSPNVRLVFNPTSELFEARVPLPMGTTYTFIPHVWRNGVEVRASSNNRETVSVSALPLTLDFIRSSTIATSLYKEDQETYRLGWFAAGSSSPITEPFSIEPEVRFTDSGGESLLLERESDGFYTLTWTADQAGEQQLRVNWSAGTSGEEAGQQSGSDPITESGTSEALTVNIMPITGVYIQITCGDAGYECARTTQTDDIDLLQSWSGLAGLWRRTLIGVRTAPQIRVGVVLRAEDEANAQPLSGDDTTVSFQDVFNTDNPEDLLSVTVRDANGSPVNANLLSLSNEGTAIPGTFWFTLSDVPENTPLTVNIELNESLTPNKGYIVRRNFVPAYTMMLTQDQVSAMLLLVFFAATAVLTALAALVWRGIRYVGESRRPHFAADGYVQFVTQDGMSLGWSTDISSRAINTLHFMSDRRWKFADVTGMQIKSTPDPNEIRLHVWRSLGAKAKIAQKLVYRIRGMSMFLRVPPAVMHTLHRDTPVRLFSDKTVYVLFSGVPSADSAAKPKGRDRRANLGSTNPPAPTLPPVPTLPTPTAVPTTPANDTFDLSASPPTPDSEPISEPIEPLFSDTNADLSDDLPVSEPLSSIPSSRPKRTFDNDPFAESEEE